MGRIDRSIVGLVFAGMLILTLVGNTASAGLAFPGASRVRGTLPAPAGHCWTSGCGTVACRGSTVVRQVGITGQPPRNPDPPDLLAPSAPAPACDASSAQASGTHRNDALATPDLFLRTRRLRL